MPIYQGEGLSLKLSAISPITGSEIVDAIADVEFYAPGKNPKTTPADRVADYGPVALTYSATASGYIGYIDTDGWTPGKWTFRGRVTGAQYDSWEYGTFVVKA